MANHTSGRNRKHRKEGLAHGFADVRVAILSASNQHPSASRRIAARVAELAEAKGASVDTIDLANTPLGLYDGAPLDGHHAKLVARFNEADAHVIATPIYNFAASAATQNFLTLALDPNGPRSKPFLIAAAAGSRAAMLSTDSLARAMLHCVGGIQVAPTYFRFGDDLPGTDDSRLAEAVALLVLVARATRQLRASHLVRAA